MPKQPEHHPNGATLSRLLTIDEVAEILGVAYNWVANPRSCPIPRTKIGNRVRFTEANVAAYIVAQTTTPELEPIESLRPVGRRRRAS